MKLILITMSLLFSFSAFSQLKGVVYGHKEKSKEPLFGAKIRSLQTNEGVVTDDHGQFELTLSKNLPDTLIFSAVGYLNDTLIVTKQDRFALIEVNLFSDLLLPEVLFIHRKQGHTIHKLKTLHVEEIGENELRKAACCNLSESFETNVSVDVNMTDAVSGAKKIQMMGLDGVYTQIQLENLPFMRGLESAYGLGSMPGTWIESIQITKGAGSVVNGYESMAGLINLEVKKPETIERFYFNMYANRFGRTELNVHGGGKVNERWKSAYFAHASAMQSETDENNDGFRDIPKTQNYAFLNRWRYDGKRMEAQLGVNGYWEEKLGGQTAFRPRENSGLYGVHIQTRHIDAFAKTGFFFPKKPYQSIGFLYQAKYQETDALFGLRRFTGRETRGYFNAIYDGIIGNTNHGIKTGVSLVYADLFQQLDSVRLPRVEIVPGAFAEYTYTGLRWTSVLGLRADYHNLFGFQVLPRIHGKYKITEKIDFRYTGGKGFRVPNVYIDNLSLLATSRTWVVDTKIQPEVSWNMGGSLVWDFRLFEKDWSWVSDYYYTFFENQWIVDRDQSLTAIYFRNWSGQSFSHSVQTELSVKPIKGLELRAAYKYLDVRSFYGGSLQQQVMIPSHRGFFNAGYITRNKRWEFDGTISIYGKSRLHESLDETGGLKHDHYSAVFALVNAQITHVYKKWDFYIGGENITNYKQQNPIIDAANPFSPQFDATRVWAPIQGVNVYVGVRYKLKK